jgi:tRNA pseudouridine38-40 synthase
VILKDVAISSQPYGLSSELGFSGLSSGAAGLSIEEQHPTLVAIKIVGKSFVYRQVRNMVGCLLEVGREKCSPDDVKQILDERDRAKAPSMAPARGLFLADVKHGDFRI